MITDYIKKVVLLAEWKYEIEKDIIMGYEELIAACYVNNFTARKTVEVIAEDLFK